MAFVANFSFLVKSFDEVEMLNEALYSTGYERHTNSVRLYHVLGTTTLVGLNQILFSARKYKLSVALLHYETLGRESAYAPCDVEGWPGLLKELGEKQRLPPVELDPVLSDRTQAEYQAARACGYVSVMVEAPDRSALQRCTKEALAELAPAACDVST